jgi:hypothetical protein
MWRICVRLHPAAFFNYFLVPLIIRLAARLLLPTSPTTKRENGSSARRYGICIWKYGAAPFRRAHEISLGKTQRSQDSASPESTCTDIK